MARSNLRACIMKKERLEKFSLIGHIGTKNGEKETTSNLSKDIEQMDGRTGSGR